MGPQDIREGLSIDFQQRLHQSSVPHQWPRTWWKQWPYPQLVELLLHGSGIKSTWRLLFLVRRIEYASVILHIWALINRAGMGVSIKNEGYYNPEYLNCAYEIIDSTNKFLVYCHYLKYEILGLYQKRVTF
jgi:hypothetical protein